MAIDVKTDMASLSGLGSGLLSLLAHELRTPLAAASSSAELMQMRNDTWTPEKRGAVLTRMRTSLHKMDAILDDLSLIERTASERNNPEQVELPLSLVVADAASSWFEAEGRDPVVVRTPHGEGVMPLQPTILSRAIYHLLSYLVPEAVRCSSISVIGSAARFVVELDSVEAKTRVCDPESHRQSYHLRLAQILVALHEWRIEVAPGPGLDVQARIEEGSDA